MDERIKIENSKSEKQKAFRFEAILKQNICQKVITIKNIVIAKTHCGRQLTEIKLSKALIFPISIY